MASPQLENGYMRLAHEITAAVVKANITLSGYKVLLWILRLTYGYGQKQTLTSVNSVAKATNLSHTTVRRAISRLNKFLIVKAKWVSNSQCEVLFNKDFDTWKA